MSSPDTTGPVLEVLGVRHHGPGSARSVLGALEELRPDLVVIEGPPELDGLVAGAADQELVPPVAALVYAVETPRRSSFYPLAVFSPEWIALQWALNNGISARFADLPATHTLAENPEDTHVTGGDVVGTLARAAGYDDPERWWEDAVEHRAGSTLDGFAALRDAMAEVRASEDESDPHNDRREAAMRRVLRSAVKEGHSRIAMVCGAYHAPALVASAWPPASRDNALLSGLPKTKVAATWAPWTSARLAFASGYGAGVRSPGWYQHLFVTADRPEEIVPGWLTRVARELRRDGLDAAPASVVEAVRMAEALAAVRSRPSVGLSELNDATRTVLCGGSDLPLHLIEERLIIGEELGRVPDTVPLTPLAQDLARLQRSLRLKPSAVPITTMLDLRKDSQRDRSVLLHRLNLLNVAWGQLAETGRTTGTFKEAWSLQWQPEFAIALIEAGLYGTTVLDACEAKVAEQARDTQDLPTLGHLIEACLTADLPHALDVVVDTLALRTAQHSDTLGLLEAVEPLARTRRYGDVRGADTDRVAGVLHTVVLRAAVGLRPACASLDDEAAEHMRAAIDAADRGVALVEDPTLGEPWRSAIAAVAADGGIHGTVGGRANRMLLDAGVLDSAEIAKRLSRQLSRGAVPVAGAAWLDGFLRGDALLLLHDRELLAIIDTWVTEVDETVFEDLLPLLRRTFTRFDAGARRQIGTSLKHQPTPQALDLSHLDLDRGMRAALRVAELLGLPVEAS